MPLFTPPTTTESSDDVLFGRYKVTVGQSVLKVNGVYTTVPYPWLGEIADLVEGSEWFQGGRTYQVTDEVAAELQGAGYTVHEIGYGEGGFGLGKFGGVE